MSSSFYDLNSMLSFWAWMEVFSILRKIGGVGCDRLVFRCFCWVVRCFTLLGGWSRKGSGLLEELIFGFSS